MTRGRAKLLCGLLMMLVFGVGSGRAQQSPGPQGPEQGVIRRQTWLIPAQDRSTLMWTNVFQPPGAGPFPLAVINHGSTDNALQRTQYRTPEYLALTEWLVAHGYAVAVPQRPGHSSAGVRINLKDYFKGAIFEARFTRRSLAEQEFLKMPHGMK